MRPFEFVAPKSLDAAIRILARANGGEVRFLAGGTDLIDQIRVGRRKPDVVMDVKRIPELMTLRWDPATGHHIGAGVACATVYENGLTAQRYPAIDDGARLVGAVQIQNRASLGGNVCNGAPSADTSPGLLIYGTRAVIGGPRGRHELPLEEFFVGPGQTALARDEMLLELVVPPPPPKSSSHYLRFIPRNEMDIAVAGVASLVALNERGQVATCRIALAAVAPTPIRAKEAESAFQGKVPTAALVREVSEKAASAARPINDVRGSIEYRKELVKVLTRRTLERAFQDLGVKLS